MQNITPFLWYNGQAEEAAKHYTSIFKNSRILQSSPMSATFELDGRTYIAFNGGPMFQFTPAFSLMVNCASQAEIDEYWDRLMEGGEAQRCGWLTDKFGMSWQIVPASLPRLLAGKDSESAQRVMQAMLGMVKMDIAELEKAYEG